MPRAARQPSPENPSDKIYAAILKEAAAIAEVPLALDAELAVSHLLGGVYATTAPRPAAPLIGGNGATPAPSAVTDTTEPAPAGTAPAATRPVTTGQQSARAVAVGEFGADFGRYLAKRRTAAARAVRAALAALLPDQVSAPSGEDPAWLGTAGKVTCTGTWAARDVYGDQTSYVASFSYQDPELGGPDHAVSYLLDHNLGLVKSVSIGVPAEQVVNGWYDAASDDPEVVVEEVEPGRLRGDVSAYLATTDALPEPPTEGYVEERTFGAARLRLLPEPGEAPGRPKLSSAERDTVVDEFLASPEAELDSPTGAPPIDLIRWCARAAIDFAVDDNAGDPLRWSPTSVELMLLDWAPRQLSHLHEAAPWLPEVLDAFVDYAGRLRGLPSSAVEATRDTITESVVRYTDLMSGEALGEPVTDVLARMVADGVDPLNEEEVLEWVLADRARRERED